MGLGCLTGAGGVLVDVFDLVTLRLVAGQSSGMASLDGRFNNALVEIFSFGNF